MIGGFRLADGVGWADFRDSIVVVVDRTLIEFSRSQDLVSALFERLATDATLGELEPLLPGIDVPDLLERLRGAGVVVGGPEPTPHPDFAPALRLDAAKGRTLRIHLDADPEFVAPLVDVVEAASAGVVDSPDDADVSLVLAASPGDLARRSADCWRAGRIHLPLSAYDGHRVLVGPFAVPGLTACFDCLLLRRAGATTWSDSFWDIERSHALRRAWRPEHLNYAGATAVRVVATALVEGDDSVVGTAIAWDPRRMSLSSSRVWSVPRCPTCSPLETYSTIYPWREPAPIDREYWDRSSAS